MPNVNMKTPINLLIAHAQQFKFQHNNTLQVKWQLSGTMEMYVIPPLFTVITLGAWLNSELIIKPTLHST